MFRLALYNLALATVKYAVVSLLAQNLVSLLQVSILLCKAFDNHTIRSVRQSRARRATCLPRNMKMLRLS